MTNNRSKTVTYCQAIAVLVDTNSPRISEIIMIQYQDGPSPRTQYNPHRDGICALAFDGVRLLHAGVLSSLVSLPAFFFPTLSANFITRNVVIHLEDNTFSLLPFYTRSVFRLYPVVTMTLLLTFPDSNILVSIKIAYNV